MPIDEVRIKAVRGIRSELRLEFAGRSLLIHGDNGTRKSSIVRALQWALRRQEGPSGKAPYTDEEGFRAHVLEPASSPLVRVKLTGGAVIQVTPAGEQVDSAAAPYRDGCVRANPFLHRSQLVAVLNDRPVDRFRYLEGFLDLD